MCCLIDSSSTSSFLIAPEATAYGGKQHITNARLPERTALEKKNGDRGVYQTQQLTFRFTKWLAVQVAELPVTSNQPMIYVDANPFAEQLREAADRQVADQSVHECRLTDVG